MRDTHRNKLLKAEIGRKLTPEEAVVQLGIGTMKDLRLAAIVENVSPSELAQAAVEYYLDHVWSQGGLLPK